MKKILVIGLKPDPKSKKKSSIIEGFEYLVSEKASKVLLKKKLVKLKASK